jgi:regulatory protein
VRRAILPARARFHKGYFAGPAAAAIIHPKMDDSPELRKCRNVAYRLLARRDHALRELATKLGRRFEPGVVGTVLAGLVERGLLDDRRFALAFAREMERREPCGERLIRMKLAQRGVEPAVIGDVLAEMSLNEEELAEEAARSKLPSLAGLDREAAARRLLSHLERRGFRPELVRRAALRALENWPAAERHDEEDG